MQSENCLSLDFAQGAEHVEAFVEWTSRLRAEAGNSQGGREQRRPVRVKAGPPPKRAGFERSRSRVGCAPPADVPPATARRMQATGRPESGHRAVAA